MRNVNSRAEGGKSDHTKYVDRLRFRSGLGKVPAGSDECHVTDQRSHALELWRELVSFASVERRALRRV